MAYLKINDIDYSQYVNKLSITTKQKLTQRENASGNMLIKYMTQKHQIQVGLKPLDAGAATAILQHIDGARSINVKVQFLDPVKNTLSTAICYVPVNTVEYQQINSNGTLLKAISFTCEEK